MFVAIWRYSHSCLIAIPADGGVVTTQPPFGTTKVQVHRSEYRVEDSVQPVRGLWREYTRSSVSRIGRVISEAETTIGKSVSHDLSVLRLIYAHTRFLGVNSSMARVPTRQVTFASSRPPSAAHHLSSCPSQTN